MKLLETGHGNWTKSQTAFEFPPPQMREGLCLLGYGKFRWKLSWKLHTPPPYGG